MQNNRLAQQLQFIIEIDKLKLVLRQTLLTDSSRQENTAEHSWHIAVMAMTLAEYAPVGTDISLTIKMLLIHDLVEIYAGDTFCYDAQGYESKIEREQEAATKLFGILPAEQGSEFKELWEEFEEQKTPSSQFAAALDRIQPFLHNLETQGGTWRIHGITRDKVMKRMALVETATPKLWLFVLDAIEKFVEAGYLMR